MYNADRFDDLKEFTDEELREVVSAIELLHDYTIEIDEEISDLIYKEVDRRNKLESEE